MEYSQWRNFVNVIGKAKEACKYTGNSALDHCAEVSSMISLPKTAKRNLDNIMLSRGDYYKARGGSMGQNNLLMNILNTKERRLVWLGIAI